MRWIVPLLLSLAPLQALHAQDIGGLSYAYYSGGDGSSMSSGDWDDLRIAQRYYRAGSGPMLYVHQDGAGYVIRDPAILRQVEAIMAPQQELGRRQGILGDQQGELGRRQGALGREQGRLGAMMADARVRDLGELGRQQAELGRQQGELGRQQGELGRQQGLLGKEQGRLARLAQPKLRALVADAVRRGLAQRVN